MDDYYYYDFRSKLMTHIHTENFVIKVHFAEHCLFKCNDACLIQLVDFYCYSILYLCIYKFIKR